MSTWRIKSENQWQIILVNGKIFYTGNDQNVMPKAYPKSVEREVYPVNLFYIDYIISQDDKKNYIKALSPKTNI